MEIAGILPKQSQNPKRRSSGKFTEWVIDKIKKSIPEGEGNEDQGRNNQGSH